jgi:dCMP deaminase
MPRYEVRTPCFAQCADCNCRPDLLDRTPIDQAEVIMTPELRAQLEQPKIDKQREWDSFFIGLAKAASVKSKDPSTKSGTVIVRPDNSVASIGFNGFPKKMQDRPEWYNDRAQKYPRMIHSEINAAIFCRDQSLEGYALYNWPLPPCRPCALEMIQHGIVRFVAPKMTPDIEERWGASVQESRQLIADCGLELLEVEYE